jgi:hypothetical protein
VEVVEPKLYILKAPPLVMVVESASNFNILVKALWNQCAILLCEVCSWRYIVED